MKTRGIEHIALTVPDVEAATRFFQQAFGATVMYDGHSTNDPPVQGPYAEAVFGMPEGGKWVHRRLLTLGSAPYIELFRYQADGQREAARTFDYGLQHIALYVDDLQQAADFAAAGGTLYPAANPAAGTIGAVASTQGWVYGKTPWGTVIELVTFRADPPNFFTV